MKTVDTDIRSMTIPRFASCVRHGRYGVPHDARGEVAGDPLSRTGCHLCQSITRLGLSNSIGAPMARATGVGLRATVIVMAACVTVLLTGFFLIVRFANSRLDRAVERIERVSR